MGLVESAGFMAGKVGAGRLVAHCSRPAPSRLSDAAALFCGTWLHFKQMEEYDGRLI